MLSIKSIFNQNKITKTTIYILITAIIFIFAFIFIYRVYMVTPPKVVVFDLDETLGYFVELGMFWDALQHIHQKKLPLNHFFEVMDLYPEFIRPQIFNILKYLAHKKKKKDCKKIIIFTNNMGPKVWSENISKYFNWKLNEKIFDQIIASYKVNGQIVEQNRTAYSKKHSDLLSCAKLPANTKICFIDDLYHPQMDNDKIFYVNVPGYMHSLSFTEMAERYYDNFTINMPKKQFISNINEHMQLYNYTVNSKSNPAIKNDIDNSKQMYYYIKLFFKNNDLPKTRRRPKAKKRRTYRA